MEHIQRAARGGAGLSEGASSNIIHPIRLDRLNGMRYTQIAKKYRIDPRTAKRYAEKNLPLDELEHRPFPSVLDPYKPTIQRWLMLEPLPSRTIWNRLLVMGCRCGYTIVNDYVKKAKQSIAAVPVSSNSPSQKSDSVHTR